MDAVREPVLLDQFYPADSEILKEAVTGFVHSAESSAERLVPKAVIAPHAGYVYSGPVAGSAYAYVANGKSYFSRVIIIGPSHRSYFTGLALPKTKAFKTPLGEIAVDGNAVSELQHLPFVKVMNEPHELEHCIEVQLPFLQLVLDSFSIVPLLAGEVSPEEICAAISVLMKKPGTLLVVSSDLSHYHSYREAKEIDAETVKCIEALSDKKISPDCACGHQPIRGLLQYARKEGLQVKAVHVANSFDTSGMSGRVVGYGSFVVS